MGGRILAINEGGFGGSGFRPILNVASVALVPQLDARPASTVLYGQQLMTRYDDLPVYRSFLAGYAGVPACWTQLRIDPGETVAEYIMNYPRLPVLPVLAQTLSLADCGRDPLAGFWVRFPGAIGLFSQPDWWDDQSG